MLKPRRRKTHYAEGGKATEARLRAAALALADRHDDGERANRYTPRPITLPAGVGMVLHGWRVS